MSGESDREGSSSEKFSEQLRGAQRLASRLQRAIRLGRATRREMREVDRFIGSSLASHAANALDTTDTLLNRSRASRPKEILGQLYVDLMGLFSEFRSLETHGYTALIQPGEEIDPIRLDQLIEIDTDLSAHTSALENCIADLNRKGRFSTASYDQIHDLVEMITDLLERRRELTGSA